MPEGTVSLREYLESRIDAQQRAVEVANTNLDHWKAAHNEWQRQMKDAQVDFVRRPEYISAHKELSNRVDQTSRLVYIGMGIGIAVNVAIGVILALMKR